MLANISRVQEKKNVSRTAIQTSLFYLFFSKPPCQVHEKTQRLYLPFERRTQTNGDIHVVQMMRIRKVGDSRVFWLNTKHLSSFLTICTLETLKS